MNITPVGDPIHHDFFSVAGSGFASDVRFEFTTPVGVQLFTPDFVRPHLALIARLPSSLPVGPATLRLLSASDPPSSPAPVTVLAASTSPLRLLQPGEAKAHPFTIACVANPGIGSGGAGFNPDPVLTNRPAYHAAVGDSLANLFGVAEGVLRDGGIDARMRIVSVFDPTRPADAANSLAQEVSASTTMETRRAVLAPFLFTYGLEADMVFVVHGSTTHTRASAWFTTDDSAKPSVAYSFDGAARAHGRFARIPGSAALPLGFDRAGLTVLHEFLHGASDFRNGKVIDLYNDSGSGTGFLVNKKFRTVAGGSIPVGFANLDGAAFAADPARDGLGYPAGWLSYHGEPIDTSRPNVMDNYWEAADDPQLCRLDRLTYAWFRDRLDAKLSR